jgi:putative N6-adenine-specific DNA methylase
VRLLIAVPPGLEPIARSEVERLGVTAVSIAHGAVFCDADATTAYRANLELRAASRVLEVVFHAERGAPDVESVIQSIPWAERLRTDRDVEVHVQDAALQPAQAEREAVALRRIVLAAARVARKADAPDPHAIAIRVHRHRERLTVGLDLSGAPLHRRGWRRASTHKAPLKENVAAALLMELGVDGSRPFVDPCCGSGTAVIEATYLALDKAPAIHRKKGEFAFEWLRGFDARAFRAVQEAARARRKPAPTHVARGFDLDPRAITEATRNAEHARIGHQVQFASGDLRTLELGPPGDLFANLPYGVRLERGADAEELARAVGRRLRAEWATWRAGILVHEALLDALGARPARTLRVKNGALDCVFAIFEPSR